MEIKKYILNILLLLKLPFYQYLKSKLRKRDFMENLIYEHIKKYKVTLLIFIGILLFTFGFQYFKYNVKKESVSSFDQMIPEGFVLIPIEIDNKEDILPLIGNYGVVNLYSYSPTKKIPEDIVALSLKVIPPLNEDSRFSAIVPEKEVIKLFQHKGPFYAVIQNPTKKDSQIMKKKISKTLIIIEEGDQNEED